MGCGRLVGFARTVLSRAERLGRGAAALAALGILAGGGAASAQGAAGNGGNTGTITGRVTDAAGGTPLAGANVRVNGTQLGTQTRDDGQYTLRGIGAGNVTLQVSRIGYEAGTSTVALAAGQTVTANVTLRQAAFSLQAVVTTVTGEQRKAEISNTVATIDVAQKIAETPVSTLGQLLSGRAAGVQIVSAGATGAGSRVRIRGQSSLSLANEPLVYVDGIRVTSSTGSSAIGVGGSNPSRLDDINPEEIETIDVIKGPAAATLYGTEAANGVINITTKRGKSGQTRWNVYTENGLITDPRKGTYPDLYFLWGTNTNATQSQAPRQCFLTQVASGACRADSLFRNNTLNNSLTTPLDQGNRQQYGLQVSGGSERTQFFVAGEFEDEVGIYRMPQIEIDRLLTERGVSELPEEQVRPNALQRVNLRSNLSAQLSTKADVNLSVSYINSDIRLPQNEDNGNGLMVAAMGGLARTDLRDGRGVPLYGWRAFPMGDVLSRVTTQDVNRFVNGLNARWYPVSWLTTRANLGYDFIARYDEGFNAFDQGLFQFPARNGGITSARTEIAQYTVDVGGSANFTLGRGVTSKTSTGVQWFRNYFSRTTGTGENLPPGATTTTAAAIRLSNQTTDESITLGTYVEQVFSYDDRIFLTGGARYDGNSAFGSEFKAVLYPKVGLSWVVSEEGFFPKAAWMNSLRLRGTYGSSGVQPGTTDALRFFDPVGTSLTSATEGPGVTLGSLGNANLKPEYSGEFETGFDAALLGNRVTLDLTYYNKKTRDALISRRVAPSLAGVTSRFENIGSIRNEGFELTLNTKLVDRAWAGLDLGITGSTNKNRVLKLGDGIPPIATGNRNTQLNAPGYPLYGMWGRTYTYNDANGDGILGTNDLTYSDTAVFIGPSFPTRELAVTPRLELFSRRLAVSAQFDHKAGMRKLNNTLRHWCQGGQSCRGLYDKDAPLAMQAAAIAANANVLTGYYENGEFTRFRELAVSYQVPDRFASAIRASRLAVVVTGRNLAVWTPFTGFDPESTVGNTDSRGNEEFFSTPPLRTFTARLNIAF